MWTYTIITHTNSNVTRACSYARFNSHHRVSVLRISVYNVDTQIVQRHFGTTCPYSQSSNTASKIKHFVTALMKDRFKKWRDVRGGERREEVHGEGKEELSFKKNIRRRDSVDLKSPICEDTLLLLMRGRWQQWGVKVLNTVLNVLFITLAVDVTEI